MDLVIADIRSNCSYKGISTGHYVPVAKMYLSLFEPRYNVYIAGGPVYDKYFDKNKIIRLPYNVSGNKLIDKLKFFANSICLFKKSKGKTVILQQSSDVTTHIAIALWYWNSSNLFLIRYSNEGINTILKKFIYELCKYKIEGIICPNQMVADAYKCSHIIVPDYIYISKSDSIPFVNYSQKKYDFCLLGRIAEEKGVVEIAKILADSNYKIIIAGKPQTKDLENVLLKICNNKPTIDLVLDYISDNQYNQYLKDSRYSILNYNGEYSQRSSGVVFDTLFAGVPVIGCRCKALQFIETHKLGYLYDSIEDLFSNGNENKYDTLFDESLYSYYLGNIKKYQDTHSIYAKKLIKFIEQRTGN